jgi:hypothetical protein
MTAVEQAVGAARAGSRRGPAPCLERQRDEVGCFFTNATGLQACIVAAKLFPSGSCMCKLWLHKQQPQASQRFLCPSLPSL